MRQFAKMTLAGAKAGSKPSLSDQPVNEQINNTPDIGKQDSTLVAQGSTPELQATTDDETWHEDFNPTKECQIVISDWSQTGRGSHVQFDYAETVPLKQGK
jgi:hypothetical protein